MIAPVKTADGSTTLFDARTGEHYHSLHGAETESRHVFVQAGLQHAAGLFPGALNLLEIGFGTGLNALLAWQFADETRRGLHYLGLEPFPIPEATARELHFAAFNKFSDGDNCDRSFWRDALLALHGLQSNPSPTAAIRAYAGTGAQQETEAGAGSAQRLAEEITLQVWSATVQEAVLPENFQIIFFDAFSPDREPQLWTPDIWRKMLNCLVPGGFLVTYCAKGAVRRLLINAGFDVERLPGPPFKRQMIRAQKPRHKGNPSDRTVPRLLHYF